jgi:hypothetical protein
MKTAAKNTATKSMWMLLGADAYDAKADVVGLNVAALLDLQDILERETLPAANAVRQAIPPTLGALKSLMADYRNEAERLRVPR